MGRADPHYTSSCLPSLGDVAVVGTAGTIPRLYQYNPNGSPFNRLVTITRTHLSRDNENNQMMGHAGPTSVSTTPEILTAQRVSEGTCQSSHCARMGRDTVQLETAVNTISQEYLLEFTSEYGIPEALHPELPGPEDRIIDFPEGKVGGGCHLVRGRRRIPQALGLSQKLEQPLFWVDERVFPTVVDWRTSAPKDGMPAESTYSVEAVRALDTHRTPIQKQPEMLLCVVGISRRYYLRDEVYGPVQFNPFPESHKEVPPPEDVPATSAPEAGQAEKVAATDPSAVTGSRKRGYDGADANAPSKMLRRDHADPRPTGSTRRGKSLAATELGMASTRPAHVPESALADVSDPDPLSFADPPSHHLADVAQALLRRGIWSLRMPLLLSRSGLLRVYISLSGVWPMAACLTPQRLAKIWWTMSLLRVIFFELRHLHNDEFLRQHNVNLARQVAMGSQLRLRFEQEAKLLRKSVAQVARWDKRIQAREHEIKNLEALLEAEVDMKKAAEDKSARLSQELEDMRALFSDLQVSKIRLTQQVSTLQEQVSGEEKLKAAFEEFKRYEDSRVEQRCAKIDACLDALSIDFDEELYPHMLTAIAGRRWMIRHGLRLAVMKCGESLELRQAFANVVSARIAKGMSEGLRHGVEHGQAQLNLEYIEAYDPEAETKFIAALQALKDLKYPLVDQLEGLKDAPMDVIMAALYLKSDTGDDAPQWVCDLRPSSSQLTIPVYPEVRDPVSPWACKEEMLPVDAIAANVSRAEKKKKCRIVCRTHGVGSAHHARSDGVPVSVPTVVPQGLSLLLADAATQTDTD
uniref:Transposase (Putative), gypsy type n=1 Tax=Tanacetum cinerariifolium TaxID=118510 RepID=A0A6L2KAB8_TANCI|nr:hypothetical protein [Tanacetum cinerariifolium]